MKYKLIDVLQEVKEDVEFGTCEMCFGTGSLKKTIFVLEDEYGNKHEIENGEWKWGDYYPLRHEEIENVVDFALFISQQEAPDDTDTISGWFWSCFDEYVDN